MRQAWRGCSALVQRSILRQRTSSTIHRKVDQRKPNNNKHNIQQNGFAALTCNEGHLFTSILYSTPKICTAQYRKPSNAIKRCPYRFCENPRRPNGRIEFNVFYILKGESSHCPQNQYDFTVVTAEPLDDPGNSPKRNPQNEPHPRQIVSNAYSGFRSQTSEGPPPRPRKASRRSPRSLETYSPAPGTPSPWLCADGDQSRFRTRASLLHEVPN